MATEEDDKSLKAYRTLAKELKIHLHIGSLALKFSPEKAVNRSFLISPDGDVLACYDKIHMFDIDLPGGESYRESANYQPGETAVISGSSSGDQIVSLGAHLLHEGARVRTASESRSN